MTATSPIIRTATCPLETSDRKNAKLQTAIADFKRVAKTTATLLPSFPPYSWTRNNSQIYRTVKAESKDWQIKDKVAQNAVHRVVENFASTRELADSPPTHGIPECDFVLLTNQGYDVVANEQGYGLKAKFIPYKPEWWHLDIGNHQAQYLEAALDRDARFGQAELAYNDGSPLVRIAVSREQEVSTPPESDYVVGVDVGVRNLCAVAVREIDSGEIVAVDVHPSGDFHDKRTGRNRAYTADRLHAVAKKVVSLAAEYKPCIMRLEDLTGYRQQMYGAIHDWPYNELQQKIERKAKAEGIAIERRESYYTSQECSECGYTSEGSRNGLDFDCVACGYEVNADVNAAMNLAEVGL